MKKVPSTTRDLFHFISKFSKLHNVCSSVQLYMLEDPIPKIETDTCDVFQLFFYNNLFALRYNSSMMSHENLNKNTIQALLLELFYIDRPGTQDRPGNKDIIKEDIVN